MVHKFEDLEVWQISYQLSVDIYKLLRESKEFELKNQILKSAVSVPSNIAEGYERKSNKEYIQFLFIAKGSCGELRTQLMILNQISNLNHEAINQYIELTRKISAMLYKLIETRQNKFK
jgi:four helix bundle protein